MSAIEKIEPTDGDTPQEESRGVFDFFNPSVLGRSLSRMGFSPDRAIELLVDIAESGTSDWVRLAALREIHGRLKETLILTGAVKQINIVTEDTDQDGRRRVLEEHSKGFLITSAEKANKVLQDRGALPDPNIIEAEVIGREETEEHATSEAPDTSGPQSGNPSGDWANSGNTFRTDKEGHFPPRRASAGLASTGAGRPTVP